MTSQHVDGAIIKLSAREINLLLQALRIAAEENDCMLMEYCNRHQLNQLRERLSNAK